MFVPAYPYPKTFYGVEKSVAGSVDFVVTFELETGLSVIGVCQDCKENKLVDYLIAMVLDRENRKFRCDECKNLAGVSI